jgi:hypothetical protein
MELIAVLKLVLIIGGSGLLFFSLRWLYLKLKEVNYRRGYDAANKEYQDKVVNAYNDINAGVEPFSVCETDTKWGNLSDVGTSERVESSKGDGAK